MAKFFSPDSKVYLFMSRLTDVFVLNVLWLVFSLPVVTVGISTIAAYTVTLHMAEDAEGHAAKEFIEAFKKNWKQGIPMSFISLLCLWVLWLDYQIAVTAEEHAWLYAAVAIVTAYVFIFSLMYVFPLLARYENTIAASLKNSFRISMKYFLRSLLLLFLVVLELALIMWNGTTQLVGLLIGPVFIMYTVSWIAMKIFRDLEKIPGTVRDNLEENDENK